MLKKVKGNNLNKIKHFFSDIRFSMGKSALEGLMGTAYTDNLVKPNYAILVVRRYCFISGDINKDVLYNLINNKFKNCTIIPSDNLKDIIEDIFKGIIVKKERYSTKKEDPLFDTLKLQEYADRLPEDYHIEKIDKKMAKKIKREKFTNITDNYEKNGIGYCCFYRDEFIGLASSNIFYKDGIEITTKIKKEHRRKGIATALASKLILEALKENKKVSWDAMNPESLGLARKLGFVYDSTYNVYRLI